MKAAIGPWQWIDEGMGPGWQAPSGAVSCPDLRAVPDCGLAGTYGDWPWSLFLFPDGPLPSDYYSLGSGRIDEIRPDTAARTRWRECFGDTPEGDTLADWLECQLTVHAVPDGTAPCKPLLPTHLGVCEIHVPWHSLLRKWKFGQFDPANNRYHNRVLDLLKIDMAATIADCERERNALGKAISELAKQQGGGKKEKEEREKQSNGMKARQAALEILPSKVLGGLGRKYGGRFDAEVTRLISKDVKPERPTTAISDNFNRADESLTSGPWTVSDGTWTVTSNQARNATAGSDYVSHTTQLSSADMWAQVYQSSGLFSGPATRVKTSATSSCYTTMSDGSIRARLRKYSARTVTEIANVNGDYRLKTHWLQSSGSTHTVKIDGTQQMQATDTTYTSPAYAGGFAYQSYFDNFEAEDLFAGSPTIKRFGGIPYAALNRGVW